MIIPHIQVEEALYCATKIAFLWLIKKLYDALCLTDFAYSSCNK